MRPDGGQAALVVIAVGLSLVAGYAAARWPVLVAVCAAAGLVWVVPARLLPAGALAAFVLIPVGYMGLPRLAAYLGPAGALVLVYLAKRVWAGERIRLFSGAAARVLMAALGAWILVSAGLGISLRDSVFWSIPMFVSGLGLALVAGADADATDRIYRLWVVLGAALGVYAVIEAVVLKDNPLFASLFAQGEGGFTQYTNWATYRATTTLGHPLLNSTFFACAFGLAVGSALGRPSVPRYSAAALCVAGVLLTASRSGATAVIAALFAALAVSLLSGRQFSVRQLVRSAAVLALFAVVGGALFPYLAARSGSSEAAQSTETRGLYLRNGIQLASERPLTGFGPGTLNVATAQFGRQDTANYENSYVETAATLGYPGVALLAASYLALIGLAARTGQAGACAALVAYTVSQGGYNLLHGYPSAIVMFGLLAAIVLATAKQRREPVGARA